MVILRRGERRYSRELRHLASIRFARRADLQRHLSRSIKFEDAGSKPSRRSRRSRLLSLEDTQGGGRHLAPFTNLEALDLSIAP